MSLAARVAALVEHGGENMSEILWSTLRSALGYADDVPTLLGRLRSEAVDAQREALEAFERTLVSRGEAYPASAAAATELIAALEQSGIDAGVRAGIVRLLGAIATARPVLTDDGAPTEAAGSRAAVHEGFAVFVKLLDASEREVRIAVACLLISFDEDRAAVEAALTERAAKEHDEVSRANLLACLHQFLPSERLALLDATLGNDQSLLCRRQAARSLAAVLGPDAPDQVVAPLLAAISEASALQKGYVELPLGGAGLVADSCWALSRLGHTRAMQQLPPLMSHMARAKPEDAMVIAESALFVAFGEEPYSADKPLASLQGLVVMASTTCEALWSGSRGEEMELLLRQHNLPGKRDALRALLAG